MKVTELNRDQLVQLKQRYLTDWYDSLPEPGSPSMGELLTADLLVEDETIFDYFDGIDFVEEDFTCGSN